LSLGHSYTKKIYYHDTDCGGVVYYANYLKFLEEARTEMLLSRGISLRDLALKGIGFAVARVEIEYKSPARYQDILTILTDITMLRLSAIEFEHTIIKGEQVIALAKVMVVLVGNDFRPMKIPEYIKSALV
jgi:acyl-CoA thioester hydrolase